MTDGADGFHGGILPRSSQAPRAVGGASTARCDREEYDGVINSRLKKQAEALAALNAEDRARLDRLAALAQLAADEIWPEVWQYGFDGAEESVQADLASEEYFKANPGIDNINVMQKARVLVAAYGKPKRQTG